mgnify:CR=1 FL=1
MLLHGRCGATCVVVRFKDSVVAEEAKFSPYPLVRLPDGGVGIKLGGKHGTVAPHEVVTPLVADLLKSVHEYCVETITNAVVTVPGAPPFRVFFLVAASFTHTSAYGAWCCFCGVGAVRGWGCFAGCAAYYNTRQRSLIRQAVQATGLRVVQMLSEPVAAAMAYGLFVAGSKQVRPSHRFLLLLLLLLHVASVSCLAAPRNETKRNETHSPKQTLTRVAPRFDLVFSFLLSPLCWVTGVDF